MASDDRKPEESEGCAYCAEMREKGITFFPPHKASARCESGKRPHCTCDRCF